MAQQDLTAPIDRVKISRNEQFARAYQLFESETTELDISDYHFEAELTNNQGRLLTLTETGGISRPGVSTVIVSLSTYQMSQLATGAYTLLLYGVRSGERESFVQLYLEVVA